MSDFNLGQFKAELKEYHHGTGYNKCDTLKWLEGLPVWNGYDKSYDGSLVVFYHSQFILIAGSCGEHTIINKA